MSAPPAPPSADALAGASAAAAAAKKQKLPRNMQRRANHSQIERRRREKINDCLVTLCTIVPACVREVEQRKRAERGEEEGDGIGEGNKRKRSRRKEKEKPKGDEGEEQELGLHKLEVLTHAIEYIYDLQSRLTDLERRIGGRPLNSPAYASLPSYGASGIAASLTSPIMSLSAESPILRRNGSSTNPNASPMWPMLPSSVLPLPLQLPQPMAPPRTRGSLDLSTLNSNSSFSSYIAPSPSGSSVLGGGPARRTADAELLLSFSTSPDALRPLPSPETMRPTSAVRSPRGDESLSPPYTLSPRI